MKNTIKLIIGTLIFSLITACASVPRTYTYWAKEGASKQVVKDKIGHCRIEVGADKLSETQAKKMLSYCMKADGYLLKTERR